jgi:MOSC domain-containing protein YiiM
MTVDGVLEHIHIAPAGGEPMQELAEAQLFAGHGIEGDRYLLGTGTYTRDPEPGREVTLIEIETLEALARDEGIDLAAHEHRRNLTVRGVRLNDLVGCRFRVGEVVLEATRLTAPCKHLETITGKPVYEPLRNRGGINCAIVEGGTIRRGDHVTLLQEAADDEAAAD